MPRPGEVRTPSFQRGEELPQGAATEVESLLAALPLPPEDDQDFEEEEFQPANDEEAFLLSASDRPSEPITAGAPFGPGRDFPTGAFESESDLRDRIASEFEASDSAELRAYALRVRRGL